MYKQIVIAVAAVAFVVAAAWAFPINFAWDASLTAGVTGYKLYAGPSPGTYSQNIDVGNITAYGWDQAWTPGSTYYFAATAYDATNESGPSNEVSYTVAQAPDTTPPTTPGTPTVSVISSLQLNLSWAASTDNVGVTGYRVERCQGASCSTGFAEIAQPSGPAYNNTGLAASTTYGYRIRAVDAAVNFSSYSATMYGTTSATAPAGPVASYNFNEGSGTTSADISGNNNTATLSGATWTASGHTGAAGVFSSSGYASIGNVAGLQITGSITVEAWVYATAWPGDDAAIVSKRDISVGWQLDTTIDNGPRAIGFKATNSAGGFIARYGASTLAINTWYHIAGVYDATGATMHVYLNGALNDGTQLGIPNASQTNGSLEAQIGQRPGYTGNFNFTGRIDDVRIYNRALTLAEIQTDMNTPVAAGTIPAGAILLSVTSNP